MVRPKKVVPSIKNTAYTCGIKPGVKSAENNQWLLAGMHRAAANFLELLQLKELYNEN
jgi:hypothetical protein